MDYKAKLEEARAKLGKDFITATPSPRLTAKSWRLQQIEAAVKPRTADAEVRNIRSLKHKEDK